AGRGALDLDTGETRPLAAVGLAAPGVDGDRTERPGGGDHLGRLPGADEVARDDGVDGWTHLGGGPRLGLAERRQGWVGVALPPAVGVPGRLTVADEQQSGRAGHAGLPVAGR